MNVWLQPIPSGQTSELPEVPNCQRSAETAPRLWREWNKFPWKKWVFLFRKLSNAHPARVTFPEAIKTRGGLVWEWAKNLETEMDKFLSKWRTEVCGWLNCIRYITIAVASRSVSSAQGRIEDWYLFLVEIIACCFHLAPYNQQILRVPSYRRNTSPECAFVWEEGGREGRRAKWQPGRFTIPPRKMAQVLYKDCYIKQ